MATPEDGAVDLALALAVARRSPDRDIDATVFGSSINPDPAAAALSVLRAARPSPQFLAVSFITEHWPAQQEQGAGADVHRLPAATARSSRRPRGAGRICRSRHEREALGQRLGVVRRAFSVCCTPPPRSFRAGSRLPGKGCSSSCEPEEEMHSSRQAVPVLYTSACLSATSTDDSLWPAYCARGVELQMQEQDAGKQSKGASVHRCLSRKHALGPTGTRSRRGKNASKARQQCRRTARERGRGLEEAPSTSRTSGRRACPAGGSTRRRSSPFCRTRSEPSSWSPSSSGSPGCT